MTKNEVYGYPRVIHEKAENLIRNHVILNDTMLISALLGEDDLVFSDDSNPFGSFSLENISNLFDGSMEAIEEFLDYETDIDSDIWSEMESAECEALAAEYGFGPRMKEIFEYWRVSEWLGNLLAGDLSEPVLRNDYGCWWGRTCSGQAIILDGTIQRAVIVLETKK